MEGSKIEKNYPKQTKIEANGHNDISSIPSTMICNEVKNGSVPKGGIKGQEN